LSDGTCMKITWKVVLRLQKMVEAQKIVLDTVQEDFNAVAQPNCTSCPGERKYFEMRPKLNFAHQQYLAILKMFLGALNAYKQNVLDDKKAEKDMLVAEDANKDKGPEFVKGQKKLRPHCEPWTALNLTKYGKPDRNLCGMICRMQPSCAGFGRDPVNHWCLWYDDVKPQSKDTCSSQTETEYVKKWQGSVNSKVWLAVDKVHIFDQAIQKALDVAHRQAETADRFFTEWGEEESKEKEKRNKTLMNVHAGNLTDATNFYGGTLFDAFNLKKQLTILRSAAYQLTLQEIHKHPVFSGPEPKPIIIVKPKKIKPIEGLQEPLSDAPKVLEWHDFPNSQDTQWSQQHPDCPMGTPCFCDCRCRGAPPQNFVEPPPPPYPPPPCPPPPLLPPPGLFSDIAIAQSMR